MGDIRAVGALLALFHDHDRYIHNLTLSKEAPKLFAKLGTQAVPQLLAALKDKDDRRMAAEALGEIGDPIATQPLMEFLAAAHFTQDLVAAADALGKLRGNKSFEPLLPLLKAKFRDVRVAASKSLQRMGYKPEQGPEEAWYLVAREEWNQVERLGPYALEPLLHALDHDRYDNDCYFPYVLETLGKVADETGRIDDERVVDIVVRVKRLSSCSRARHVPEAAVKVLGRMHNQKAREELKDASLHHWDGSVRKIAGEIVKTMNNE